MEYKIIKSNQYNEIDKVNSYKFDNIFGENKSQLKEITDPKWMIAISNIQQKFIFVAISYVTEFDMLAKKGKGVSIQLETPEIIINVNEEATIENDEKSLSKAGFNQLINGKTVIYKIAIDSLNKGEQEEEIIVKKVEIFKKEKIGGIVSFVHGEYNSSKIAKTNCFIFNAGGIYNLSICEIDNNCLKTFEHFDYPRRLIIELDTFYKTKSCIFRIKNCIFDHYFYIEQYREGIQVMQLYDLRTMQIQQIFNIYEEKNYSRKYSKSVLAISKNKQMIAFSSGYGKLALYLIENGIEIFRKDFGRNTKIIASDFKDDNKLMIIIKKANQNSISMLIWHLCTNKIQHYVDLNEVENEVEESILYIAKIPGKYVSVNNVGKILSIYDSLFKIDNLKKGKVNDLLQFELYSGGNMLSHDMNKLELDDHIVFHQNLETNIARPLKDNLEPWITDNYKKIWVYLDHEESMQLYIGKCTVQVWRKIEQKKKFVLEYFWANEDYENEHTLQILELKVYESGFLLELKQQDERQDQIKWLYKNNEKHDDLIRHACDALALLNYQRNKSIGYENQH
ncbi:12232_t:CDS:1, partial [Funneliformis geosporum]